MMPASGAQSSAPGAPVTGASMTGRLPTATILADRYNIVKKLGQGGMGAVYLADDLRLPGKKWAIKEMSDAALIDPVERRQAIEGFQQEARMLAQLDHLNLPKVVDYFSDFGNQYLVMEFVNGETLEKRLESARGPLPESEVLHYTEQLCDVLNYLHAQKPPIIFRDLKPGNIMIRPDGRIKLIDFGIARHFKPGKSTDTQAMGTPGYAAPEQYGKGQSDARSDVYALGVTIHHMLTGHDPSSTPFHLPSLRQLNPRVSGPLEQVVNRSIEIDPALRWSSVEDLRRAVRAELAANAGAGGPVVAVRRAPAPPPVVHARAASSAGPVVAPNPSPVVAPAQIAAPRPPAARSVGVPAAGRNYASYGSRVVALLIDSIVAGLAAIMPVLIISEDDGAFACMAVLAYLAFTYFYFLAPVASSGQTFGKRLTNIRIVDANGDPPGMGRTIIRQIIGFGVENFLMGIFFLGALGLLWPLWDAQRQTWHDKIANTFVVNA
jgi:serine/threonine-protein kinase